jgi:hypothetical protein
MRKPIHKLNGGRGATLCHRCSVIITTGFTDELFCEKHKKYDANNVKLKEIPKPNYKLVRLNDGLTNTAQRVAFIEWNTDGTFYSSHDDIQVGRSIILDPMNHNYTWLTTEITEIVEQKADYVKLQTKNSTYELHILINDETKHTI